MMSVRDFPVAEQYPSSTDTSAAGSSNRISHISITAMALEKNAPPRESRAGHEPAEGGRGWGRTRSVVRNFRTTQSECRRPSSSASSDTKQHSDDAGYNHPDATADDRSNNEHSNHVVVVHAACSTGAGWSAVTSSGQIKCQSSGRRSRRVTAPSVARSILTQSSAPMRCLTLIALRRYPIDVPHRARICSRSASDAAFRYCKSLSMGTCYQLVKSVSTPAGKLPWKKPIRPQDDIFVQKLTYRY